MAACILVQLAECTFEAVAIRSKSVFLSICIKSWRCHTEPYSFCSRHL